MKLAEPGRVSVFLTDDHCEFRSALRELVEATPGFVVAGEASSGEEATIMVPHLRPDFVLMDVWMPGMGGVKAAEILAQGRRGLLIALISVNPFELPPGDATRGGRVVTLLKEELCSRTLLEIWHGSGTT